MKREEEEEEWNFSESTPILKFYSKSAEQKVRVLSNFHVGSSSLSLPWGSFKSGEHAFQCGKMYYSYEKERETHDFHKTSRYEALRKQYETIRFAETPQKAKTLGGRAACKEADIELFDYELNAWNQASTSYQEHICREKFKMDADVRNLLQENKDVYLLHQENRGKWPIWGGRIKDGKLVGENRLGKIWMKIAKEEFLHPKKKQKIEQ